MMNTSPQPLEAGTLPGSPARPSQSLRETLRLMRSDMRFRCEWEHKPVTFLTGLRLLFSPGVATVLMVRLQKFFDTNGLRPLGWLIGMLNLILFQVQVDSRASIGESLIILHAHSVFIDGNVDLGDRCLLFHQNTLGASPFIDDDARVAAGRLRVGNDVMFGSGACAYGEIDIGDRCQIGVNTVVEASCATGSVMFGVPARVVSKNS